MAQSNVEGRRRQLLSRVEERRQYIGRMLRRYDVLRVTTKVLKIGTALLTGVAAIFTSLTRDPWAAWMTAGAGLLTAVLEVTSREFAAEVMRAHYFKYHLELKQLGERLEFELSEDKEVLTKYQDELHRLETKEARERPSLHHWDVGQEPQASPDVESWISRQTADELQGQNPLSLSEKKALHSLPAPATNALLHG